MERATFIPPLHGIADVTLDLIEKLSAIAPGRSASYAKPLSGGSEAVETAPQVHAAVLPADGPARQVQVPQRLSGLPRRATFGAMGASGTGRRKTPFEPQMPGFLKVLPPIARARPVPVVGSKQPLSRAGFSKT